MKRGMAVGLAVILLTGLAMTSEVAAQRNAKWTMIMIVAGNYDSMQEKLELVGASSDVNVIVLHDPYGLNNSFAYRMPNGPGAAIPIPLNQIFTNPGQEIAIADRYVLDEFLDYVQTTYPADHYLLSLRGNEDFYSFIEDRDDGEGRKNEAARTDDRYDGITIVNFEWVMQQFVARNGGQKCDILHFGLCLSGVIDWIYEMADYCDYFVGTEHNSNPPVAAYWRNYRYAWEMTTDPDITPEYLATRMVEIFLSHAYDGYHTDEPATASAIDLSAMPAFSGAISQVFTRLRQIMSTHDEDILRAISETERFGYYRRLDIRHFLENLVRLVDDAQLRTNANLAMAAFDNLIVEERHEHFRDANGIMIPVLNYSRWNSEVGSNYLARYGTFAEDTGFDDFMDALPMPSAPVSGLLITEINPYPMVSSGTNGDRVEIYNKGSYAVDLRGLSIDDLDAGRMYAFVDGDDVNHIAAVLQPGEFAVVRLRRAGANPYPSPADAEVIEQSYGVDIISYIAGERTILSDHDDQVVLMDRDYVLDAVAWHNGSGSSSGIEAVNLERLVELEVWQGAADIAQHYFMSNFLDGNTYESDSLDFGYIAGSEPGSIQRCYNGLYFSEGALGADSSANFCVCRNTNLGTFTPTGQSFEPRSTPNLLITEVAPNITATSSSGDKIEIYNLGPEVVDLYDVVLSDLDPGEHEEDLCGEEIQIVTDDIGPDQVLLYTGYMVVVELLTDGAAAQPAPQQTTYGWLVKVRAGEQFNVRGDHVALLNRDGGDLIDSLVYANNDLSEFDSDSAKMDFVMDMDALTQTHGGFGFVLNGGNAWTGANHHQGQALDAAFTAVVGTCVRFPWGQDEGGSIQRTLQNSQFRQGNPDSAAIFTTSQSTTFGVLPGAPPATATPTPTGTAPTPTPTPFTTATPSNVECSIYTNQGHYRPNDLFVLSTSILNTGNQVTVDEYIILDVWGEYWFWPNWGQDLNFMTRIIQPYNPMYEDILNFVWPSGAGAADNIIFWLGLLQSGTIDVHCIHYTSFGFSE
ncbi:lamin tail domain-containing protein [bacterium]|nr:lamin tail domain-containing protein [candidate division CSSED10-310 bacterium]